MLVGVLRLVVLALALSGCARGCTLDTGGRAEACDDTSTCAPGTTCHDGYCLDSTYVRADEACHAGSACVETGACDAVRVRSFLGVSADLECAATTDDECRQSRACRTRGACARVGPDDDWVGCGAATPMQCLASERCATHEECELTKTACARDWSTCPAMPTQPRPSWADSIDLVWDFATLRTPWHPGSVERATLACSFGTRHRGGSTLRIAGRCTEGPEAGMWLRADVPLHVGDEIAVAVQRGELGDWSDAFAKLTYTGESPMRGGGEEELLECAVVPHAVALERSKRELAAIDDGIASAAREQPDLYYAQPTPAGVDEARVHAERAAKWLGWTDPELASRIAKVDAAMTLYATRLDKAIRAHAGARTAPGRDFKVTVLGRVCGAALTARVATVTDGCAVELAIDNVSDRPSTAWLTSFRWLRRAHGTAAAAAVVPTRPIEVRVAGAPVATDSPRLAAGQRAVVLVGGLEDDALLAGRLDMTFVLKP